MIFKTSRLSDGNKLFPVEIEFKETSLEVKSPGLFNSVEKNYDYEHLGELEVNDPMLGYCSISFMYKEEKISVHGFSDEHIEEIQKVFDQKKSKFYTQRGPNLNR